MWKYLTVQFDQLTCSRNSQLPSQSAGTAGFYCAEWFIIDKAKFLMGVSNNLTGWYSVMTLNYGGESLSIYQLHLLNILSSVYLLKLLRFQDHFWVFFPLRASHHWCAGDENHFRTRRSSLLYHLLVWLTLRGSLRRNGIAIVAQDSHSLVATTSSASPLSHLCVCCGAGGKLQCGNGAESKTWPLWSFSTPYVCLCRGFSLCYVSFLWSMMLTWPVTTVHFRISFSFPLVRKSRKLWSMRQANLLMQCHLLFQNVLYPEAAFTVQWHDDKHGQNFVLIVSFQRI